MLYRRLPQEIIHNQLPIFLWGMAIFVSSSIPSDQLPPLAVFGFDKLVHFAIFLVFCWLSHRALRLQESFRFLQSHSLKASIAITVVYGILDELHQSFVPGRNSSAYDVIADAIGAVLYGGAYWVLVSRSAGTGKNGT